MHFQIGRTEKSLMTKERNLYGTTGDALVRKLALTIKKLQSGPLGGNQQIGALLRMAVVWNIPIACNRASADFMISSPLMEGEYLELFPGTIPFCSQACCTPVTIPQQNK